MFEIIDESIRLASCSIADLTSQEVQSILNSWEPGTPIGTLTLYYDRSRHMIVLNRDNKDYNLYKEAVLAYLQLDSEERQEVGGRFPALQCRKLLELLKMLLSRWRLIRKYSWRKKIDCGTHRIRYLVY